MIRASFLAAAGAAATLSGAALAGPAPSPSPDGRLLERIDAALAGHIDGTIGFMCGIVNASYPSGILHSRGTLAGFDGGPLAFDESTPFEIASISKCFTIDVLAQSNPNWSDPLSKYFESGFLPEVLASTTLQQVAQYYSGLPEDSERPFIDPSQCKTLADLSTAINAKSGKIKANATCATYSNLGFALLGLVAASIQLKAPISTTTAHPVAAYDAALTSFLAHVGLKATESYRPATIDRLPQGHGYVNEVLTKREQYVPTPSLFVGSGGLVSNGADMLRYLLYSMGRLNLDVAQQAGLEGSLRQGSWCKGGAPVDPAYGWFTETHTVKRESYNFFTKYGAVTGFQSFLGLQAWSTTNAPSANGVFFLTNSNVLDPKAKDDQAALAAKLMTLVAGASEAESSSATSASPAYR